MDTTKYPLRVSLANLASMSKYLVSAEKFIPVPAQEIFDIVADPKMHPLIDGSGSVLRADVTAPEKLFLGAEFGFDMKIATRYRMVNTVVEYEEGKRIAWKPRGDYLWRYTFEPVERGTLVKEEWDARSAKRRLGMRMLGFPRRNFKGITTTLDRLHDIAVKTAKQS